MQLVFAGKDVLEQAKQIFAQLVTDLTNHTGNASTMVQAAINQVAELLKSKKNDIICSLYFSLKLTWLNWIKEPQNKRDVSDFLLNVIGLQGVWDEIQNLGATFVTQILNEAMQLVFAGQDKLKEAQQIFAQLVSDLTNHTGNAATIVQTAINMVAEILKSK